MLQLRTPLEAARWLRGRVRGNLHSDSRRVGPGDGFIAWPGAATDGRHHVPAALAQGAVACLVEREGAQAFGFDAEEIAGYAQLKAATGPIAAEYYGHPSAQIDVVAVTGTNGKTSTAWWLAQALSNLPGGAWPCGVIGTLGTGRPPEVVFNGLTTPDPVLLQREFRRFADEGLKACAIEASSVGIAERRLDGTQVRVAVFTNFTQDHLDYHATMQAYWLAKAQLFQWPGLQSAVLNIDDEKGAGLASTLAAALDVWTVSCQRAARLQALDVGYDEQGLRFTVAEGAERHPLATRLIGHYNVANLLGAIGAMRALGVPLAEAVGACRDLLPVPGRMELVQPASRSSGAGPSQGASAPLGGSAAHAVASVGGAIVSGAGPSQGASAPLGGSAAHAVASVGVPIVAVDYAHTPDALDKALQALRPLAAQRGGSLWCVFGCGGDRDPTKRPLMAAVAEKNADRVVVTSDNPRTEKPEAIISQILLGLSHHESVQVQADRAQAIAETVTAAAAADVILLAGKGHEDYQEIAGVKHRFDDKVQAQAALDRRVTQ